MKIQANAPVTKLVEPASLTVTLTPTEAYYLYALLGAGVTFCSLRDVGLLNLHAGLERQMFGDGPCAVAQKWFASDVLGEAGTPLKLYKTRNQKVLARLRELEKVDA